MYGLYNPLLVEAIMRPALKLLIILLLAEGALFFNEMRVQKPGAGPIPGITKPGLAMQFVTVEDQVTKLLGGTDTQGESNRQVLRWQQWIDFLYIALYWAFFFFVIGGPMRASQTPLGRILGQLLGVLITVAALSDVLEDVGILLALNPGHAGSFWPFPFAVTKWFCFYLGLLSAAAFFISYPRLGAFPVPSSKFDLIAIFTGISLAASSITGLVGILGATKVIDQGKAPWLAYAFVPLAVAVGLLLVWFIAGVIMRPAISLRAGQH